MTRAEVYENLCSYDPRNEYYKDMIISGMYDPGEIPEPRREKCYCDNCSRGKDKLAVEILRLMDIIEAVNI